MKWIFEKYILYLAIMALMCVYTISSSGSILSKTDVSCIGSFDDEKHYFASVAKNGKRKTIMYANEIHSISGEIELTDSFWSPVSDNDTNLYVALLIKYNKNNNDNITGIITGYEKVGLSVFDCGDNSYYSFATGSSFNTFVLFNKTDTLVDAGDKPYLSYGLQAEGESYNKSSTPFGAIKTGVDATISDGEDSENYSEHYNISGYFKISKSIKFAK